MTAQDFASDLLAHLRQLDPRANALEMKAKKNEVILGIDDDGFVPILRLAAGSAKFNKMMLFVYHMGLWQPTCIKETSSSLAQLLAGELNYLWTIHVSMMGWKPDHPEKNS